MPYKKTYRKKRTYKKKISTKSVGRYRGSITSLPRNFGLPAKLTVNLPFSQWGLNTDPSVGQCADYVFSANGIYDPNISGTGHQPRYFDQLFTCYDHAIVIASKIEAYYELPGGDAVMTAITLRDSSGSLIDPDDVMEGRYTKLKPVSDRGSGTNNVSKLTLACNPNKFLAISKPLTSSVVKNSASSNPSEQAFYHCCLWALDGGDAPQAELSVRISYTVVFVEPKQPSKS